MPTMKNAIKKAQYYVDMVMPSVCEALTNNGISYEINKKGTEITIESPEYTEDSLFETLLRQSEIPTVQFVLLLEITETGGVIYIRKKMK